MVEDERARLLPRGGGTGVRTVAEESQVPIPPAGSVKRKNCIHENKPLQLRKFTLDAMEEEVGRSGNLSMSGTVLFMRSQKERPFL